MQAIIVQSFVAAPPGSLWAALFTHTDVLFDALPADGWPEPRSEQAPVHLSTPWPFTPAPTEVAVTLFEMGGGTRLDLRHTGWGDAGEWEVPLQGHFAGWLQGLAALGLAVETGEDARTTLAEPQRGGRYFISGEIPALAAAVYRSLVDDATLERWSDGVFASRPVRTIENRFVRWRYTDGREVTAILRPTPRGTHIALAEYGGDQGASQRWPGMFENLTRFLT